MIEDIFPIKIYKTRFVLKNKDLLIDQLEEVFKQTEKNNQGSMRGAGLCSYNAARSLQKWSELKDLSEFLIDESKKYWNELKYDKTRSPSIYEMWANRYERDSFIDEHNHAPIPITVSYYLKKPKNSGNIVFVNPLEDLLKHQPFDLLKDRNMYHTLFNSEIAIEENDVIMFPGWLRHKTTPNASLDPRIIIGANLM